MSQMKRRIEEALEDLRERLDEIEDLVEDGDYEEALDILQGTAKDELDTLTRRVRDAR